MPLAKPPVILKCQECGSDFNVQPYRANTAKYCNWLCGQRAKNKKSTVVIAQKYRGTGSKGYVKLNGRHEHRVVAEQKLGRALLPGEIVHHIDENKHNNHPDNLEIMSQPEHVRMHIKKMHAARIEKAGY